jgi:hypothetical protein
MHQLERRHHQVRGVIAQGRLTELEQVECNN